MKEYRIYMQFDRDRPNQRLLTTAHLKSVPVKRNEHSALYNLMEGIKIGVAFAPNKKYISLDFIYEEVT